MTDLKLAAQKALEARRELLDDDGENRAVRAFLMHYGAPGLTVKQMRDNMRRAGWADCWPAWVGDVDGHLTKGGAQAWLRYLFALEPAVATPPLLQKEEGDGKDAARYRWLRDVSDELWPLALRMGFAATEADAAIDAAIATRQGEKPE